MNSLMAVLKGREMVYDGFEKKYFNFFMPLLKKPEQLEESEESKANQD